MVELWYPAMMVSDGIIKRCIHLSVKVLAILLITCTVSFSLENENRCQQLWSKSIGLASKDGETRQIKSARSSLEFLDNGRLVFTHVDKALSEPSKSKNASFSAYVSVLSIYDAESGKEMLSKKWNTHANGLLMRTTNDGLLVQTDSEISLYSPELVLLKQLRLPTAGPKEKWAVSVSPSGNTVLLNHERQAESRVELRAGTTLNVENDWIESPALRANMYAISDSALAYTDSSQQRIVLRPFGSEERRVIVSDHKPGCVSTPAFINSHSLLAGICNTLTVLSTSGETLFAAAPARHETVEAEKNAIARNGQVFAVSFAQGTGEGLFDTDVRRTRSRIVIYSLSRKQPLLEIQIPAARGEYSFALSPDGRKLAVLSEGQLSMCIVPSGPGSN